ncbi:receptor kinase 5 precursor [Fusarium albosuccineum]|uniref:Receptor kinase 5 n=1 Tax=Fusarium albosuccineum TaxID=1237068 RepID=A0A8H4PDM2_9HYPO|nr:receptor kinase 5 precursor [Fusarium albosuccineum]
MDDSSQKRMSAIPRLSKLPMPRPTSGIPKPTSALPRPASVIRPSPSRESLGGELRNPRLRPSLSRDQLRSSIGSSSELRNPRLRTSASQGNLNAGTRRTSLISRPPPQATTRPSSRPPSTPRRTIERQPDTIDEQSTTPPYDPPGEAIGVEYDGHIFHRQLTLTRRPSEVFATSPLHDPARNIFDPEQSRPPTASTDDGDPYETIRARPRKPRPSLSERTIETLASIPSSPALSKKSSNFFDQSRSRSRADSRPRSRADSGASRPGSSYASDNSARLSSRPGSRPGSSSGPQDPGFSSFRASSSAYKPPLTTIDGTPQKRSSVIPGARTPAPRAPGSRAGLASASKASAFSDARSPSPGKATMPTPKSGSKSLAIRPAKTRAPAKGLFKKPSLPALDKSSLHGASRNASGNSSNTSWDGTIPSSASTTASNNTRLTVDSAELGTPPSARKSSAALREQIAKAKAARRAQMKQAAEAPTHEGEEAPIVPSDTGFDFGVNNNDPFNARRGEDPKKKVLQNRVNGARTTGRLNIAALDLKEIPVEVLKMYDLESIGTFDGSWAESVDLTRFVAADNELEELDDFIFPDTNPGSLDDSRGSIFAGLETLDMHGNLLVGVPLGMRRLSNLTSLNLSNNRLTNNSVDTISQISCLRDLKLANNLFFGPLNSILSNLSELEILDVHGNNISALPNKIENMSRLRILNLSENSFESLPFDGLANLSLTELNLRKNKLKGTLIEEPIGCLPQLHTLDASGNQLQRLVPLGSSIDLPVLHSLSLSMNRLQGLPDMTSWTGLLTLTVDENNISGIPNSFMSLEKLRHADFSSNDIRVVPPEVSRMENLSMLRLSGNPLRDKKFLSITTDELKETLAGRLEPPPPYQEPAAQVGLPGILGDAKMKDPSTAQAQSQNPEPMNFDDDDYRSDDDFATPPQSPSRSRSHTVSSRRSRSHTVSNQTWPVKPGGILDRSRTESSSLHPVVSSKVAAEHQIRQVFLQNNLFATFPNSLSFFAETLTILSLSHNQLMGEAYLTEDLEAPALKELNLASNHITGLGALTQFLHAPNLEKVDISLNRVNALPIGLKEAFPGLKVLIAANNHIVDLDPDMIKGIKIVDVSNNDIAHLNPRIGLLGGPGGLERFDVMGNRFRVPRWNVLERGTEATLRWLRGRVPVAEMAAWKGEDDEPEVD